MVTSELIGKVSMGVLLVFLVSWRRGRYIGSDQQGDIIRDRIIYNPDLELSRIIYNPMSIIYNRALIIYNRII